MPTEIITKHRRTAGCNNTSLEEALSLHLNDHVPRVCTQGQVGGMVLHSEVTFHFLKHNSCLTTQTGASAWVLVPTVSTMHAHGIFFSWRTSPL